MLGSFQTEIGHFTFDHPRVGTETSLRDATIRDIVQKASIQMIQLLIVPLLSVVEK